MAVMTWDEGKHHRDRDGQFTHATMGAWAAKIAADMIRAHARSDTERRSQAFGSRGARPPGFEVAKRRHMALEDAYAQRQLTTDEMNELKALDQAFRELVTLIGHEDSRYDFYGEDKPRNIEPAASRQGFRRVGEHPERLGAADGPGDGYISRSSHPLAGGIWIDPDNPGTQHAPSYRNDAGHIVSDLRSKPHRTATHKQNRQSRRREDWAHTPDDRERVLDIEGGKIGYRDDVSAEFLAWVKRAKARTRAEAPPQTWIMKVNDRYEQRRDRRRG